MPGRATEIFAEREPRELDNAEKNPRILWSIASSVGSFFPHACRSRILGRRTSRISQRTFWEEIGRATALRTALSQNPRTSGKRPTERCSRSEPTDLSPSTAAIVARPQEVKPGTLSPRYLVHEATPPTLPLSSN